MVETKTATDWADAALEAFAAGGIRAASIPAIARTLGVTKGSFYWHFRSLDELIAAALDRWQERDRVFLDDLRRIADPRRRLRAVFDESLKSSQAQALFMALSGSSMPRVSAAIRRVSDRRIAFLADAYRELGFTSREAQERAILVYAAYVGILHLRGESSLRSPKLDVFVRHAIVTLVPACSVLEPAAMKRAAILTATAAALSGTAVILERTMLAAPHYHGPRSDHFDGERFFNDSPLWQSERSFLKWQMNRDRGYWREWVDAPPGPRPPQRVDDLRVTFVNHATVMIQIDGMNILTDPIWSERCSPFSWVGPKRHRPPGIRFDDLPPIDLVLVSHNHYDHLDVPTLRALQSRFHPRILTPLGNSALMARYGIRAEDMEWWQTKGNVTLVQAQHFCARGLTDRNATLWGGFVIHGKHGNVYFAGDTGWGEHFARIAARYSPIRFACLPIGAYLPRWFMQPAHIDPLEAVEAHNVLGASISMPMHYGTFDLGDDGETEPLDDLRRALASHHNPSFWILEFGEGRDVPR